MANNALTKITIVHNARVPVNSVDARLSQASGEPRLFMRWFRTLLDQIASGIQGGEITYELEDVTTLTKSTGTITCTGVPTANDTVTIGGVTLTWVASAANENQVTIGGSATLSAAALAAAINAHSKLKGLVVATSAAGVCTITCAVHGRIGNLITTAESGTNTTVQQAVLAGAVATQKAAARTFDFGGTG